MTDSPLSPIAEQAAGLARGLLEATRYSFTSQGTPGVAWHVRRFTLVEALSEPYRLSVELLTDDLGADVQALLGASCELQIDREAHARTVCGVAARLSELGVVADRLAVHLEVVPQFALLEQSVNTRCFQALTAPEILKQVLDAPLAVEGRRARFDLAGGYERREYCVQFRESDFDFACRLMQEEGIVYFFEHEPNSGAELLVLVGGTDRCRPLTLADGGEVVSFVSRGSGTARREAIDALTPTHALRTTSIVQRDFDWKQPAESPYWHERRAKDARGRDREVYEHHDRRLFTDDGAKRARHKHEQQAAGRKVYLGTSDVAELTPGYTFAMLGHPQPELDQEYLVVRVRHRGEAPEEDLYAQESSERQVRYANEIELIERATSWRPERSLAKPKASGPQTAIVVGPAGEEIHTDEHGRIKVHFHWDRLSPFDDTASCWIRVAQRWAGPSWGALFLPRIGMEVLVEFIDGDPDRPMVTGCVYNGMNPPPYPLPDQKTKSTIKSESSPGGGGFNEIRFEDAKGAEEIFIHAQLDMHTKVLRDAGRQVDRDDSGSVGRHQKHSVGVDRTASVGNDEKLSVGNNQSQTIGVNQTLAVGADQKQTIGANQTEQIGANQKLAVGANRSASIGANQSEQIGANQTLSVGGNQTVSVGGWHKTTIAADMGVGVGADQTITVGGTQKVQVGANAGIGAGANLSLSAGAKGTFTFGADHDVKVSGNRSANVGGGDSLTVAGALTITAASITLSAGGSTVEIGPGGVTITAGALVNITGATVNINS